MCTLAPESDYPAGSDLGVDLDSLATEIVGLTEVISCHPNYTVDPLQAVQGSLPISDLSERAEYEDQAATQQLDLDGVHELSTGAGVKIALLDGGVNYNIEALADVTISGFDLVDNDADAFDEPGGINSGHGAFVAGIIHLTAPDAEIWAYRVTDTAGASDGYLVAEAIMLAVDDGCRIISLSMVMSAHHMAISRAINYARGYGVLVVVAAGNGPTNPPMYPADDGRTLAVAAVDSNGVLAEFSSVGSHIDICTPGVNLCSPYLDATYARWSGTSFATPFVAGQAALILSYNPELSSSQIINSIISTGSNVDPQNPGFQGQLGGGLANLSNSILYDPVVCGDVDGDHELGFSDLIYLLDYVTNLYSDPPDFPMTSADTDSHSGLDAGDIVYLREHMMDGGPAPCMGPTPNEPSSGGRIVLDHVDGMNYDSTIALHTEVVFHLKFINNTSQTMSTLCNGFRLDISDDLQLPNIGVSLAGRLEQMETSGLLAVATPVVADNLGFLVWMPPTGGALPQGSANGYFSISVGPFREEFMGTTITLDSAAFGRGGIWSWSVDAQTKYTPDWGGSYTFTLEQPVFVHGDLDNNGLIEISDLVYMVDFMFRGGPPPVSLQSADVNGSCDPIDISDLVYMVDYMFRGGPAPVTCL